MTYEDSLEFLGYSESKRHPIEILGFEYTTQGMKYFRSNKPDVIQILSSVITQTINEYGTYPADIPESLRKNGAYIFTTQNDEVIYSAPEETMYSKFQRFDTRCKTSSEAAIKLIERKVEPELLK